MRNTVAHSLYRLSSLLFRRTKGSSIMCSCTVRYMRKGNIIEKAMLIIVMFGEEENYTDVQNKSI
jgi:hypothetical protein